MKRTCPQVANFDHFSSDFAVSDYVIISTGINDISCYNHTAKSLYDLVRPKIVNSCKTFKSTTFIFNSLIHTRHAWLNSEVDYFNSLIFGLTCELENFKLFDSLVCLKGSIISHNIDNVLPIGDKRGVHISRDASHVIGTNLTTAVELLAKRWTNTSPNVNLRGWMWPLSPNHSNSVLKHMSVLGKNFVFHREYMRSPVYKRI